MNPKVIKIVREGLYEKLYKMLRDLAYSPKDIMLSEAVFGFNYTETMIEILEQVVSKLRKDFEDGRINEQSNADGLSGQGPRVEVPSEH
jgi:hypothetical protein